MIRVMKGMIVAAFALGLTLGLGACSKKATTETTPSSAPAATVQVTDVDLGRAVGGDKRVTDKTDTFAPKDVIYASVLTSGTAPSATLKARWTFQDGQVVDESQQAIAPTGDEATEFHVSKPDGWPAGKYKVEVFLDGNSVKSKDFTVK